MKRIVLFFTVIAALVAPFAKAAEKPLILSTIKPIHALVNAIAGDAADSQQIMPDYASPHHYSLKPSELRLLNKADLVFRIDPAMESQLTKSLRFMDQSRLVTLSQTEGLELLSTNHKHDEDSHLSANEGIQESDKKDDHNGNKDYHFWLSPKNAILMSEAIRDSLTKTLPQHAASFKQNTQKLNDAIQLADTDITAALKDVTDQPFLVMHDAWQYFTHHYKLNQLASVTQQEGLKPSAKALSAARKSIRDSAVRCIVNEPGVKSRTLAVLTEDLEINTTEIDPLGRKIAVSDQAYPELLRYTATQLLNCLK